MKLPHFSAAAHVVHQIERVSFAANESHQLIPKQQPFCVVYCTSTTRFNVANAPLMQNDSKALPLHDTQFVLVSFITFLAPLHS